jgi:hypothetical protein
VDIKVVFPPDVLSRESAKVDFVEHDLVGVADAPETRNEGEDGDDRAGDPGGEVFGAEGGLVEARVRGAGLRTGRGRVSARIVQGHPISELSGS